MDTRLRNLKGKLIDLLKSAVRRMREWKEEGKRIFVGFYDCLNYPLQLLMIFKFTYIHFSGKEMTSLMGVLASLFIINNEGTTGRGDCQGM